VQRFAGLNSIEGWNLTLQLSEIIKMSTQIKKRLTIEKDMAILFSYVVNKINRMIMLKKRWRYLRIAGIT